MFLAFATFAANLTDPALIVLSLVAAPAKWSWLRVFMAALVIAVVHEAVLFMIQLTREFDLFAFALSFGASFVWLALAWAVKRSLLGA